MLDIISPAAQIKSFQASPAVACTAKVPVAIGGRIFIPLNTTASGEQNTFVYECELRGAAKANVACNAFAPAYALTAGGNVTSADNSGANPKIGHFIDACLSGDAVTGRIAFNSFA